ncbi:MAG: pyridoxal 5'-phosphate synthase glutaminase subunit PdxT [Cenarchaeum sp. SB0661_bin_35]|nr:pyridoxal 5'-phosphate synthase glutaminase subunit PdxT [Cenarchaeum sp. SB0667_bin_13]MXZ93259.1 pyridoxal 5'-phosphate synthase glutaminase subunit PdxT [Cenarchaeum sp. SB0666_bin_15]MYC79519.1 pyridoxal 5'-phosphate synthase glutaminase subunit PdxT [Cenarchaeum sp. SB0661_bin_35]MYD58785.1 pyridoxal 5'-phosphate synthase glutaminase subunit PdxT [Cenarchaeum sp. SB0678_bin_8]MYI51635.1 pyridoxal 5'-phosphate synthase glutaminase subunit PdxT [Cenarchaeum sp. SB0673_bin_9]MYJ28205.1 py
MSITVGVLSIQGDVCENMAASHQALDEMNISGNVIPVKTPSAISDVDVMIIPGGESTTIGLLTLAGDTLATLGERIRGGMPTLGVCAGLILLAGDVTDRMLGGTGQPLLKVLDIKLERNSFGRQRDSFETILSMKPLGIGDFPGVFIRAPSVTAVSPDVEVLSVYDNRIVAVKQNNTIGTSFHPELSGSTELHRHLIDMARR